jgi:hypothetical protein
METEPERPLNICELCRESVDPADPDVVRAFEVQTVRTFGGTSRVEGLASYFHRGHFPGGPSWLLDQERADLS